MDSNDKIFGILGYIGILWLIPLCAGKTEFCRFHANQGLVLFLACIVLEKMNSDEVRKLSQAIHEMLKQ